MLPGSSKTQPERVQLGDIRVQNWIPERGVDGLTDSYVAHGTCSL